MISTNDSNPRYSRNHYDGKMLSPMMEHLLFPYRTGVEKSGLNGARSFLSCLSSHPFGNTLYAGMTGKIGNEVGTRKRGAEGSAERGRRK